MPMYGLRQDSAGNTNGFKKGERPMVSAYRPTTLEEALVLRSEKRVIPFSGGTDLMVQYRIQPGVLPRLPHPVLLLTHLSELSYITSDESYVRIGAGSTLDDIATHKSVPELMRVASAQMASPALRNLATAAGNIANASPAGDTICALTALDARLLLVSAGNKREISIDEFITGPGSTVLQDDEILAEILIPCGSASFWKYRKVGTRRANALSKVSLSVDARIEKGTIKSLRLAVGAVAPKVVRSRKIEAQVVGLTRKELKGSCREILRAYDGLLKPISDQRSTEEYRRRTALNLTEQVFLQLLQEE